MTHPRRIYLLNPQAFRPETIAVAFAKTSRSPLPFDEIAAELNEDQAARFHEKWVVGYGHASVAEHAVLHIAIENVSRLAIETIENNRLASFTEKSTRYQQWEDDAFYIPAEIRDSRFQDAYVETCQALFRAYQAMLPAVKTDLMEVHDQLPGETDRAYQRRMQSDASDVCRFLLPAASLANVGVTINARALEYAICKMLSSPLSEVQSIGEQLRIRGREEAPTLIKYADCNAYLVGVRERIQQMNVIQGERSRDPNLRLVAWDQDGEERILAAILGRFGAVHGFHQALDFIRGLPPERKQALAAEIMAERQRYDQPLRELEYATLTVEAVMDQGAYYEFKRHRMMTQSVEPLGTHWGYAIPAAVVSAGCLEIYEKVMRQSAQLFQKAAQWNPAAASYIVPNGFNRRVLFMMNLREAFHFCRLRSAETAHFSIRRIALHLSDHIRKVYPLFGQYLDVPQGQNSQDIEQLYFSQLQAE